MYRVGEEAMGSELLLWMVWSTREPDFDAVRTAIRALSDEALLKKRSFMEYADIGQGSSSDFRELLLDDLDGLEQVWHGADWPDSLSTRMGPVKVAITGGESWGDTPSSDYDSWIRLENSNVLDAGGFFS